MKPVHYNNKVRLYCVSRINSESLFVTLEGDGKFQIVTFKSISHPSPVVPVLCFPFPFPSDEWKCLLHVDDEPFFRSRLEGFFRNHQSSFELLPHSCLLTRIHSPPQGTHFRFTGNSIPLRALRKPRKQLLKIFYYGNFFCGIFRGKQTENKGKMNCFNPESGIRSNILRSGPNDFVLIEFHSGCQPWLLFLGQRSANLPSESEEVLIAFSIY